MKIFIQRENLTMIFINLHKFRIPNKEMVKEYNFDHPNALDFDSAYEHLLSLMEMKTTEIPIYCFKTHSR